VGIVLLAAPGALLAKATDRPEEYALVPLALIALWAAHEFGHMIGARLARFRITAAVIGFGPRVARRGFGWSDVDVRMVPVGEGLCAAADRSRQMIRRASIFAASGPIAFLALAGTGLVVGGTAIRIALLPALAVQLVNLVPFQWRSPWGGVDSDGALLLRCIRHHGDELRTRFFVLPRLFAIRSTAATDPEAAKRAAEALTFDPAADDDVRWLAAFAARRPALEESTDEPGARARLLELRERRDSPAFSMIAEWLLFETVYVTLLSWRSVDGRTVEDLRELSASYRGNPTFAGPLAWALVETGAVDDGRKVIERALASGAMLDRGESAAWQAVLGIAQARSNRLGAARATRMRVAKLDPACPVLPHLDAAMVGPVTPDRPGPPSTDAPPAPVTVERDDLGWVDRPRRTRRVLKVFGGVTVLGVLGAASAVVALGVAHF
jgi:hypothetical protein